MLDFLLGAIGVFFLTGAVAMLYLTPSVRCAIQAWASERLR